MPGLTTDLIKSAVYFDRRSVGWPAGGLAAWAVAGVVGLLTAALVRGRRPAARRPVPAGQGGDDGHPDG
ncbi:hypothetical protein ACFY2R_03060 [Micromonospora olivasterospora]|uniref:hypothetical protein n=1 Tax=Micromonospora olivasterospora TaxID=1880 RepID=UPI001FE72453|nr:hypothetical protein [Micromonospora olivasterospora]